MVQNLQRDLLAASLGGKLLPEMTTMISKSLNAHQVREQRIQRKRRRQFEVSLRGTSPLIMSRMM